MFVRIYWAHIVPGTLPDIERKYREWSAAIPGRLLRWVTQDVNDPESVITITLWDSAESVAAWESSAPYAAAVEAVKPFLVGSQAISLCEIKVDDHVALLDLLRTQGRS